MNKGFQWGFIAVLAAMTFFSGCASRKSTNRQFNAMQAQMGVLTDEVVRLDESLQSTRSSIQDEENRKSSLTSQLSESNARLGSLREEESVIKGIYRTPSGFELPSVKIQQALKSAGYYQGAVDGKIGPQTRKAVQAFQRDNGLSPDGIVGRNTWNKLKVYTSAVK